MRRRPMRLDSPLAYAVVGISILAVPAAATAVAQAASPNAGTTVKARVKRNRVSVDDPVVVVGRAPSSDHGQTISLQFTPFGSGHWRRVASARIAGNGSFRLVAWLTRSGWLRVLTRTSTASAAALPILPPSSRSTTTVTAPQPVAVAAAIRIRPRAINDLGTQRISLHGRLLPGTRGRRVQLQADRFGRWVTLASARTNAYGGFFLRYQPGGAGQEPLRIRFSGDHSNTAAAARAGTLTVYQQEVASWYNDGGTTGCGFHAYYGVANVSLPCGTSVTFDYGGRTVHAVVDDRGPYVGGRTWDLNQNTAAALGFAGVGTVWSSR